MIRSIKDKILLSRLAYFFKHFKADQKKFMADSVDDFLEESDKNAPRSKSLSKILDFMAQKVFQPIGKFGRPIPLHKQSPQTLKRRREKMRPSFMALHSSSVRVQKRYRNYLGYASSSRRSIKKKTSQIENV